MGCKCEWAQQGDLWLWDREHGTSMGRGGGGGVVEACQGLETPVGVPECLSIVWSVSEKQLVTEAERWTNSHKVSQC